MQQIKISNLFLVLIAVLFVIGCNDAATDVDTTKTDSSKSITNNDSSTNMPAYDSSKDPLPVKAAFATNKPDTMRTLVRKKSSRKRSN